MLPLWLAPCRGTRPDAIDRSDEELSWCRRLGELVEWGSLPGTLWKPVVRETAEVGVTAVPEECTEAPAAVGEAVVAAVAAPSFGTLARAQAGERLRLGGTEQR